MSRRETRISPPLAAPFSGLVPAGLALLLLVLPVLPGASAQETEPTGLTIYSQDVALVRHTVQRSLEAGETTVTVDGLPPNLREASLVVVDPGITLLGTHGRRTYRAEGGPEAVALDLDLEVEGSLEGLRLAFLTGGMGWSASYSMIVDADDRTGRIDGYASLANGSGTTFEDATVQLLAGSVNVSGGGMRFPAMQAVRTDAAAQAPGVSREAFAGYHLYDVDRPLTLHAGASRRIRLFGAHGVDVTREHVLDGQVNYYQQTADPQRQEAVIRYRVERSGETDFASTPLPSGSVRIYRPDDQGRIQLLGVDQISNTPAREELVLEVGRAFDIGAVRTQTAYERPGGDVYESAWEVALTNRSDEDVVVQVHETIRGDWEILSSSHEAQRLSAGRARFDVPVPADGEATLEYRVRVRN